MKTCLINLVVMLISLGVGFALGTSVNVIPKDVLTQNRLLSLERRIQNYYRNHKRMPSTLDELMPECEREETHDAWNKPIEYKLITTTNAVLISHGNSLNGIVYTISKDILMLNTVKK